MKALIPFRSRLLKENPISFIERIANPRKVQLAAGGGAAGLRALASPAVVGHGIVIEVYRISISKKQFRKIPKEERGLVLVAGHILNQISVFMKLVKFSTNKERSTTLALWV